MQLGLIYIINDDISDLDLHFVQRTVTTEFRMESKEQPSCDLVPDEVDDDLDLLDDRTDIEAMWNAKLEARTSQPLETHTVSSDNESVEDNIQPKSETLNVDLQYNEIVSDSSTSTISSSQSQNEISKVSQKSENTEHTSGKKEKWSFNDLYDIGIGPKPDVIVTGPQKDICQNVELTQQTCPGSDNQKLKLPDVVNSGQSSSQSAASANLKQSQPVALAEFDEEEEELEDYVDSDSEEYKIPRSPVTSPDLCLKRSFTKNSDTEEDSDIYYSPIQSSSPDIQDRVKAKAVRKYTSPKSETICISGDETTSPEKSTEEFKDGRKSDSEGKVVHSFSIRFPNSNTGSKNEDEPPHKMLRLSGQNGNDNALSRHKKSGDVKFAQGNTAMSKTSAENTKGDIATLTTGRESRNQAMMAHDHMDIKESDIDKVCDFFPDADREWVKLQISIAMKNGMDQYLDRLVDSMADGHYSKVSVQKNDNGPDVIVALGNSKIQSSNHCAVGHTLNQTDSGPAAIKLYGKEANFTKKSKGKGKALIQKKPVKNVLDEIESSDDEKDICMDHGESMEILRDDVVSSSSLTCESCKMNRNSDTVVQCCDGHLICNLCVEKEVKEILSPDSQETHIKCPCDNCPSKVPESQAKKILPNLIIELLEEKLHKQAVESIIKMEDLVTCPNCSFPVLMDEGVKQFECPSCKKTSCRYCKRIWSMTSHDDCNRFTTFLQENMDSKDLEPPSYWHPMPEEGDKDYIVVTLEEKCVEYKHIKSLFAHSMSSRRIFSIRRIQNPRLWQKFCLARKHMIEDSYHQNQLNEKQLFHGTSTKAFDAICREGLDWRMCGENGTAFGQGTYFAKRAHYSDRYSGTASGAMNSTPLSQGSSSAAFAQAFNIPSAFNFGASSTVQGAANTFQFGTSSRGFVHRTSSNIFPNITSVSGFSQSNTTPVTGLFGPTNSNPTNIFGQPVTNNPSGFLGQTKSTVPLSGFGLSNSSVTSGFGSLLPANIQGHTQGQMSPTVNNSQVSSTTDKIVFSNVEEIITSNRKYMFVARALVGRYCRGNPGIRKPPSDPDDPKRRPFNSCVDDVVNPSIFVIFDCAQCYPEYIIEYKPC